MTLMNCLEAEDDGHGPVPMEVGAMNGVQLLLLVVLDLVVPLVVVVVVGDHLLAHLHVALLFHLLLLLHHHLLPFLRSPRDLAKRKG